MVWTAIFIIAGLAMSSSTLPMNAAVWKTSISSVRSAVIGVLSMSIPAAFAVENRFEHLPRVPLHLRLPARAAGNLPASVLGRSLDS